MGASGRELRETLNGGSKSESENLVLYGAIAGVIMLAAIIFVVAGLMTQDKTVAYADADSSVEREAADFSIDKMNTAEFSQSLKDASSVMAEYNSTLAKLRMCSRGKDHKKFKSIIAAYEKRNAAAVASWQPKRSKMYDKMLSGKASDLDMVLYARGGGLQKDVLAEIAMTDAVLSTNFERMDAPKCMKFSGDVRMKKFDIEPRQ